MFLQQQSKLETCDYTACVTQITWSMQEMYQVLLISSEQQQNNSVVEVTVCFS